LKPLDGLLVLDFSQFLAGPSAALRLADLGARVIKVERPSVGDLCRQLYISNLELDGDSTLFHSINRNKESVALDLKRPDDLAFARRLIERADVLIQNFRPGVMEKIGLHYDAVKSWNPRLVYATVTGYGEEGPWRDKPGQDLLAQSLSGLTWLSGDAAQGPVPMGLAIADMFASAHLVQGILACLVRRGTTVRGGRVDVSLMESILDYQFEVLTTHLNDGGRQPQRSSVNNAHAYLGAPYGIYRTADGYLAIAMGSVPRLGELLGCAPLGAFTDPKSWFNRRDEIKRLLADHLRGQTTGHWLGILEPADVWCAEVLDWPPPAGARRIQGPSDDAGGGARQRGAAGDHALPDPRGRRAVVRPARRAEGRRAGRGHPEGVCVMNPNPDPAKHGEIPVWNAEDWMYEDIVIGKRIRSIRRTISEGESMQFNALVLDMHPYVADELFAKKEGVFGRRLVAGAFVFSAGLGLVATNCVNAFSYGYDKLRFIKPVFIGDTIYTIKTDLEKRPRYKDMGLCRASYEVFKNEGELVLYCEHLQTVKYRDPAAWKDQVEKK
jgi:CoA:oxalate CoA-transferase